MSATPAWLAAVEALLNRGISTSTQAIALARRLEGSALQVDIDGIASIRVNASHAQLSLITFSATAADPPVNAGLSGTPMALLQLARGGGNASRSAKSGAQVRGDAEIANAYRQLFELARPDWEDELARHIGDVPARRLSQLAERAIAWARRTRHVASANMAEYLQEEGRDVVNKTELDEFLQGVDSLREAADRAAARLAHLEQRAKDSH